MRGQAWLAGPDEQGQAELLTAFVQDLMQRGARL